MALALLGVRLLLALVFVAAGVTKLRDRQSFSQTLVAFAVPRALAAPAATLIPLTELASGLLLLPAAYAWWGGLASLVLLALFTTATSLNLLRGQAPDCACFGASTAEPIGPATLVRNGALIALALFVLLAGPGDEFTSARSVWVLSTPSDRALGISAFLVLIALALLNLRAGRRRASNRPSSPVPAPRDQPGAYVPQEPSAPRSAQALDHGAGGLPVGVAAPAFDLPRLEGGRASLASFLEGGRPVALIFLSAHCPSCQHLWPDIEEWQVRNAHQVTVVEVCSGSSEAIAQKLAGRAAANVLLEGDAQVADSYGMSLKPSVVIVGPGVLIESISVAGPLAIRALVAEHLNPQATTLSEQPD